MNATTTTAVPAPAFAIGDTVWFVSPYRSKVMQGRVKSITHTQMGPFHFCEVADEEVIPDAGKVYGTEYDALSALLSAIQIDMDLLNHRKQTVRTTMRNIRAAAKTSAAA